MIRKIAGTTLNVATGGAWGAAKWIGRRFKGDGNRQTLPGRVAVFVLGNLVLSVLMGRIGIWKIIKGIGYVLAVILAFLGWDVRPPAEDQAAGHSFVEKVKDAAEERFEKMKEKMEREAEELRRKHDAEINELKHAADAKTLQEGIEKLHKQAEAEVERKKVEAAVAARFQLARAKAEKMEAARSAVKLRASLRGPDWLGRIPPRTEFDTARENAAVYNLWMEQRQQLLVALARAGIYTSWGWSNAEMSRSCEAYKNRRLSVPENYENQAGPIEDWNAFQRTNDGIQLQFFLANSGIETKQDPGPIEPLNLRIFP